MLLRLVGGIGCVPTARISLIYIFSTDILHLRRNIIRLIAGNEAITAHAIHGPKSFEMTGRRM